MKAFPVVTAALVAAAALFLPPNPARAQAVIPDAGNGCGIISGHSATVVTPVRLPVTGVYIGGLAGPGGTLGITSSAWLASLTVNAYERTGTNDAAGRRVAPARRVRPAADRR